MPPDVLAWVVPGIAILTLAAAAFAFLLTKNVRDTVEAQLKTSNEEYRKDNEGLRRRDAEQQKELDQLKGRLVATTEMVTQRAKVDELAADVRSMRVESADEHERMIAALDKIAGALEVLMKKAAA